MKEYRQKQVNKQINNEKISKYKKKLNTSFLKEEIKKINNIRREELKKLIIDRDILHIRKCIMQKKFSVYELVLFYLERIYLYDKNYNSVICLNENALNQARYLDKNIKNIEEFKLFGIPILVKDNIATVDNMPNTAGAKCLENSIPNRESFIVKKLKEEGAIILGKTNLSEWANFMSDNSSNGFSCLGGQTKNAVGNYDVGGSSAGSAVAVKMNFCAAAIGTETCGSIIYPSVQNQVFGLKPTLGSLSRDLIIPITEVQDTPGPIARNIEDIKLLYEVMRGEDKRDKRTLNDFNKKDTKDINELCKKHKGNFKIGVLTNDEFALEVDESIKIQFDKIINKLEKEGIQIQKFKMDKLAFDTSMMSVLYYGFKRDLKLYLEQIKDENIKCLKDVYDFNNKDLDNNAPFGQKIIEDSLNLNLDEGMFNKLVLKNKNNTRHSIDKIIKESDVDAIISIDGQLSVIYSAAGYPALTIPVNKIEGYNPLGITIVGSGNDEIKMINLAKAINKIINGVELWYQRKLKLHF